MAEGILGVLRTPVAGTIKGTTATRPSAGDLFFTNAAGEFVQFGWYLGGVAPSSSSTGLPDAETNPRLFWGESIGPGTEALHAGITLSWGTYYQFKIEKTSTPGIYNLSIQGIVQAQNYSPHSLGIPVFQGEVNNLCTTMDALASHASAPKRTLEYLYNGAWNYWDTTNFPATPGFFTSENVGDIATDHAYSNP